MLLTLLISTMVRGAHGLPVRLVPEAGHVTSMRLDVVDHAREWQPAYALGCELDQLLVCVLRRDAVLSQAVHTERMRGKVPGPRLLPLVRVAALGTALLVRPP